MALPGFFFLGGGNNLHLLYILSMYSSKLLHKCKRFPFSLGTAPKLKYKNASSDNAMIHVANTNKIY